jgi:hypothetical protein
VNLTDLTFTGFGFVTLWIAIIAGLHYLTKPRPVRRSCCLDAACSGQCAARLSSLRDDRDVEWHKVVGELRQIVTAGQAAASPEEDTE